MAKRVMEFSDTVQVDRSAADVFAVVSDLPGLFTKLRKKVSLEAEREVGEGAPAAGDVWRVSGNTQFGRLGQCPKIPSGQPMRQTRPWQVR